jgi:hypothetical protein
MCLCHGVRANASSALSLFLFLASFSNLRTGAACRTCHLPLACAHHAWQVLSSDVRHVRLSSIHTIFTHLVSRVTSYVLVVVAPAGSSSKA